MRKVFKFLFDKEKIILTTTYLKFSTFQRFKKEYLVYVKAIHGNTVTGLN